MDAHRHALGVRALLTTLAHAFEEDPALQALTEDERADVLVSVTAELAETSATKAAVRLANALAIEAETPHQALLLTSAAIAWRREINAGRNEPTTPKIVH